MTYLDFTPKKYVMTSNEKFIQKSFQHLKRKVIFLDVPNIFWYPPQITHTRKEDTMEEFNRFLEYEKELAAFKLKTINRLQKGLKPKPKKRTSQSNIAEHVLRIAGRPLHVSEIIQIANRDFNVQLQRDSIVSILIKKIKAGQKFVRTAPNTFALKQ